MAKATGWGEKYLINMPYARFLMYVHCNLLANGGDTRWAIATDSERRETEKKLDKFLA